MIEKVLVSFRKCFSRRATFEWYCIIVMGLMIRSDQLGVTSIIRDLALRGSSYETLIHFFRSTAWKLADIRKQWREAVMAHAPVYKENGRTVLIGDGVKQSKEGRFMPGVKRLHQESENSSKAEYIFGHMLGGLGVLIGGTAKWFCLPLSINIQDGLQPAADWNGSAVVRSSHVVQMVDAACEAAKTFGESIVLFDRYFLSVPALERLRERNEGSDSMVYMVTKAKRSSTAYEKPIKQSGRGRPRLKGEAVKVFSLFETKNAQFEEASLQIYGRQESVRYYAINLLWGQKLYQELRFVLVEFDGVRSILVTTDLAMEPLTVIRLYSYRFKIECTFRELKQQIGAFCYRFWTGAMPKLNRFWKKGTPHPLENVQDDHDRQRILKTVRACECFVMLSCIAMGLLQMLALAGSGNAELLAFRYTRTPAAQVASEATIAHYLRHGIFPFMANRPHSFLTRIIRSRQKMPDSSADLQAS